MHFLHMQLKSFEFSKTFQSNLKTLNQFTIFAIKLPEMKAFENFNLAPILQNVLHTASF